MTSTMRHHGRNNDDNEEDDYDNEGLMRVDVPPSRTGPNNGVRGLLLVLGVVVFALIGIMILTMANKNGSFSSPTSSSSMGSSSSNNNNRPIQQKPTTSSSSGSDSSDESDPKPDTTDTLPAPTVITYTSTTTTTKTTNEPTSAPSTVSPQPTAPPSAAIQIQLGCLPDRFDNEEQDLTVDPEVNFNKLYPGQFICSRPYRKATDDKPHPQRYRFGLAQDSGNIIWHDTIENEIKTIYHNTAGHASVYFTLRTDATMVLHDAANGTVLWEGAPVNIRHPMTHHPFCLSNHDCPYYHLHSDGVLVLNYIAGDGAGWIARNMFRAYNV